MTHRHTSSRAPRALHWTAALLCAMPLLAPAQTPLAVVQPAASEIGFVTKQLGVPVEGKFTKYSAQIALDPKKPETGTVNIVIDTGSARFGTAELDAEVPKPVWLSAAKFPQATFQSTAIKAAGPGKFDVTGKLTIKGTTRDLVVPVALTQAGSGAAMVSTAVGSFTIKRLDFKVGEGEWSDTSMLANDVAVRFKLSLAGVPAL